MRTRKMVSKIRRNACRGENKVVDSLAITGNPSQRGACPRIIYENHLYCPVQKVYSVCDAE